ncbi:hypothetical protein [Paenibacillus eucommiae]|uniref:CopG family transcriptional regulator n=1 Tax=Paenibacillus eucommiae TaxID=1355755 RepID=A0ABS4J4X8_9BACL|nr:hypothetical protein [Paenibacillus eucommiae]MBP1994895.1 hypothetical protein [Paenibacillus eucommiae]
MTNKHIKLGVPKHEGQLSMMFSKGGSRDGSGRKALGETKKVSLTLSTDIWNEFENHCNTLKCSKSEGLRGIIEAYFRQEHIGDR